MPKIFLVGYGKMGQKIHQLSENEAIKITGFTRSKDEKFSERHEFIEADGIIEFTGPDSAIDNIKTSIKHGKFVVSGSTGWTDHWSEIEEFIRQHKGRFFYASNFSIGANIMFEINQILAQIMSKQSDYHVEVEEIHHLQKVDKPSGTAITIAEGILAHHQSLEDWVLDENQDGRLTINALREEDVKGTHTVTYSNQIDQISVQHKAFSRDGFALGAIKAAIWMKNQSTGIFHMKNMMKRE